MHPWQDSSTSVPPPLTEFLTLPIGWPPIRQGEEEVRLAAHVLVVLDGSGRSAARHVSARPRSGVAPFIRRGPINSRWRWRISAYPCRDAGSARSFVRAVAETLRCQAWRPADRAAGKPLVAGNLPCSLQQKAGFKPLTSDAGGMLDGALLLVMLGKVLVFRKPRPLAADLGLLRKPG